MKTHPGQSVTWLRLPSAKPLCQKTVILKAYVSVSQAVYENSSKAAAVLTQSFGKGGSDQDGTGKMLLQHFESVCAEWLGSIIDLMNNIESRRSPFNAMPVSICIAVMWLLALSYLVLVGWESSVGLESFRDRASAAQRSEVRYNSNLYASPCLDATFAFAIEMRP